jgi:hypothetical protein
MVGNQVLHFRLATIRIQRIQIIADPNPKHKVDNDDPELTKMAAVLDLLTVQTRVVLCPRVPASTRLVSILMRLLRVKR